jgi:hypothetical protein
MRLVPFVYDDGVGHTKPVDSVKEELDSFRGVGFGDEFCLNPLGELLHRDKQVVKPPGVFLRGPTMSRPQTTNNQVRGMV